MIRASRTAMLVDEAPHPLSSKIAVCFCPLTTTSSCRSSNRWYNAMAVVVHVFNSTRPGDPPRVVAARDVEDLLDQLGGGQSCMLRRADGRFMYGDEVLTPFQQLNWTPPAGGYSVCMEGLHGDLEGIGTRCACMNFPYVPCLPLCRANLLPQAIRARQTMHAWRDGS